MQDSQVFESYVERRDGSTEKKKTQEIRNFTNEEFLEVHNINMDQKGEYSSKNYCVREAKAQDGEIFLAKRISRCQA